MASLSGLSKSEDQAAMEKVLERNPPRLRGIRKSHHALIFILPFFWLAYHIFGFQLFPLSYPEGTFGSDSVASSIEFSWSQVFLHVFQDFHGTNGFLRSPRRSIWNTPHALANSNVHVWMYLWTTIHQVRMVREWL